MESSIYEIADKLKEELLKVWESGGFRRVVKTIEVNLSTLKSQHLLFFLQFDLKVVDRRHPLPAARIPLTTINTTIGATGNISKELLRWKEMLKGELESISPEDKHKFAELFEKGVKNPIYRIRFAVKPSLQHAHTKVCNHCMGEGYLFGHES